MAGETYLKRLRAAGIVGILTAAVMIAADVLLLYAPEGGYEVNLYAALVDVPLPRMVLGHYLGVLAMPFYLIATWHLYEGLKPGGAWVTVPVIGLSLYSLMMASLYHGSIGLPAAIYQQAAGASGEAQAALLALADTANVFYGPFGNIVYGTMFLGSAWMMVAILTGRTAYPRWFAFINPLIVEIVIMGLYFAARSPITSLLFPPGASISFLLLYAGSTVALWNGGRHHEARKRDAGLAAVTGD